MNNNNNSKISLCCYEVTWLEYEITQRTFCLLLLILLQANSGFYYVRANKKTQYLFTSLLYHNVLVALSGSHQQVMIQLMQEHSSLFGLEVKVFDRMKRSTSHPAGICFVAVIS